MSQIYDVIVLGAGPAGLSAGLYAARSKMKTLVLEKSKPGGQIVTTLEVANYPGGTPEETGPTLIARMEQQCALFGAEIKNDGVAAVSLEGDIKTVTGMSGEVYQTRSVIIATGASPRKIGCPGEAELTGKGVSYCATCDGDFFTDLEVFAVGGGEVALEEGMFLTKFARKVTIIHRRDEFRAAKSIVDKAKAHPKMDFILNAIIKEIRGEGIVESIVLEDTKTGEITERFADPDDGTFGIFVFVGFIPATDLFKGVVELDPSGYIPTDDNMRTNIPGVFAAGDVRVKSLRQVVTATADGAIAAIQAEKYCEQFH